MIKDICSGKDLLKLIESHTVAVYGCGYVAQRFYQSLENHGVNKNVICFLATNSKTQTINEKKVLLIDEFDLPLDTIICIATHESLKDEIIATLQARGIHNYIWIFPFQQELMFGEPLKKSVKIPIHKIISSRQDEYWLECRYVAIENYYNKNEIGYNIYLKSMEKFIESHSAKKRLEKFLLLIKSWEKKGFDSSNPIAITEDYRIIDGAHRLSLACYFGMRDILCDVYPIGIDGKEIHSENARLTKECIKNTKLNLKEIELMETAKFVIDNRYR